MAFNLSSISAQALQAVQSAASGGAFGEQATAISQAIRPISGNVAPQSMPSPVSPTAPSTSSANAGPYAWYKDTRILIGAGVLVGALVLVLAMRRAK